MKHLLFAAAAVVASAACADAAHGMPVVPAGFRIEAIAHVPGARELAVTPNGDLLVGTSGPDVGIVPNAEGDAGQPSAFVHLDEPEASGVALAGDTLYVGTTYGVWKVPYERGERRAAAAPVRLLAVRQGGGRGHSTTSVAVAGDRLYASVGSSCNACDETDPSRATIQTVATNGAGATPRATHIRNAIALAIDPSTGDLWAGAAGQDELEHGHPYEIFDDVGARSGVPNYGWPTCYENRQPVAQVADCSHEAVPIAAFPAYETPIGATFYSADASGRNAFPPAWRGGAFVTLHGSWHTPLVAPLVVFVPIDGHAPRTPVDWNDSSKQWRPLVTGWQNPDGSRIGRPTGIAVGTDGSLFVADDDSGTIYRIRPAPKG